MASNLGLICLSLALLTSIFLTLSFIKHAIFKTDLNYKNFYFSFKISFFLIVFAFIFLIIAFIFSDFSILAVYENSHTDKPLFYKISGTWGNHEGSMLLFILVISLYGFLFIIFSKNLSQNLKSVTVFFQSIIQIIFLIFLVFTSNPFEKILPIPNQGLGLNPILQDPLLAIHPPFLYLGYVGFSLLFSLLLAALVTNQYDSSWASIAKRWIFLPWTFLTFGIGLGSFWAYYELGWGGYWFWDPVENASLMPWIASTALLHSILVMEKAKKLFNWTAILAILTFVLSLFGTFLVRSGILNSVHAFANDPSRGFFILIIISGLTFAAFVIFILKSSKEVKNNQSYIFLSREFSILVNNYLLIFALAVVIIGTTYPIILSVLTSESISVGPNYYNSILAPFVFIFLILMAMGPYLKWGKNFFISLKYRFLNILLGSIFITVVLSFVLQNYDIIFLLGILCSLYLLISIIYEPYYLKFNNLNFGRLFSHAGFGLLIFAITLNHFFSKEFTTKIPIGKSATYENFKITFIKSSSTKQKNYDELFGYYEVTRGNSTISLKPSIRKYHQPEQFTAETSIKNKWFSDFYLAMDYSKDPSNGIGIRFYFNYFVALIWASFILITLGGFLAFIQRKNEKSI